MSAGSQVYASSQVFAKRRTTTRLGYIGLIDAAPLLVAEAFGVFSKHGLSVQLSREVGWATIREKVIFGELEAAHALSTLPFVATLGLGSPQVPCLTAFMLSRGGNAIILSDELRRRGVKDKASLKLDVENRKAFRKYTLATPYSCSPHQFHLREWLKSAEIDTEEDVELVTLPPAQMCRNLSAGTIDGFCAGEPWGSLAVADKIGWCPVNSEDLSPLHPEKALIVKESFAEHFEEEHAALIRALLEACEICEDPTQVKKIAKILSDRRRVNCPIPLIERCLLSIYDYGLDRVEKRPRFLTFHSENCNRPAEEDSLWVLSRIVSSYGNAMPATDPGVMKRVFRSDIFDSIVGSG